MFFNSIYSILKNKKGVFSFSEKSSKTVSELISNDNGLEYLKLCLVVDSFFEQKIEIFHNSFR